MQEISKMFYEMIMSIIKLLAYRNRNNEIKEI